MKIHYDIKPDFVKRFKCVGPACLITCCQGWNISIDKKTHKKYIHSDNHQIAEIARQSLRLVKKGKAYYSIVRFDERKVCPFMDDNKLCTIHRDMGEEALSATCSTYPRLKTHYANETRYSMTLSCPEVARMVLFEENSMRLHEDSRLMQQTTVNLLNKYQRVDDVNQAIHLFAWNIIQAPSRHIEDNLVALAHFILFLQRIKFDLHNKLAEAEARFEQLLLDLQTGESLRPEMPPTESIRHKVHFLSALGTLVAKEDSRDGYLGEGQKLISAYLGNNSGAEPVGLSEKFAQIDAQWQRLCSDSCLSAPHVLRNYLLYRLYHRHFPGTSLETIMRQYYRLVLEYFYVKHLLSVRSMKECVDEAVVAKTLSGMAEKTMHSDVIESLFDKAIDMINSGDDLSCLLLIG